MGNSRDVKRPYKITCRVSADVYNAINDYHGTSMADKLCNLIGELGGNDFGKLVRQRQQLLAEIKTLKNTKSLLDQLFCSVDHLNRMADGEKRKGENKAIAEMLQEEGYRANKTALKGMNRLNEITGKTNTLSAILDTYNSGGYINEEHRRITEELAEEFRQSSLHFTGYRRSSLRMKD